jgi:hypothetical protein
MQTRPRKTLAHVLSVHMLRSRARREERLWQAQLEQAEEMGKLEEELREAGLPSWMQGVKVLKAGRFQWIVVGTPNAGH